MRGQSPEDRYGGPITGWSFDRLASNPSMLLASICATLVGALDWVGFTNAGPAFPAAADVAMHHWNMPNSALLIILFELLSGTRQTAEGQEAKGTELKAIAGSPSLWHNVRVMKGRRSFGDIQQETVSSQNKGVS